MGNTVGLLLHMCRCLSGHGTVVILDSGLCVLQGLIELKKIGAFASAVIKKRRYWPKYVPGEATNAYMNTTYPDKIGQCDSLHGMLDNVPYDLFVMRDGDYNMKLMSTYGQLLPKENAKDKPRKLNTTGELIKIKYTEPFDNHFLYRHAVDDHNNNRHKDISIEETWVTHRWENRVFAFILAISEVNAWLAFRAFVWKGGKDSLTLLQFRRKLANELLNNPFITRESCCDEATHKSKRARVWLTHNFCTAPNHAKKYVGGRWDCSAKTQYPQYVCNTHGCSARIRTYCLCSPEVYRCKDCHGSHLMQVYAVN
jgi:Transposase IS4